MTREEILVLLKEMKQNTINGAAYDDPKRERKFIALDEAIKELEKEPCEDAISRDDALMCMTGEFSPAVIYKPEDIISKRVQRIKTLPSVQPKIKNGKWIYRNYNWYCSECENTPKTLGYVGAAEFMKEHFKFCNHCGAMMLDTVMTEDEEEVDNESGN